MSERDAWDRAHRARRTDEVGAPDPFVSRALDDLGPGAGRVAFDLAAGRGRHALELARRGYQVFALDRSAEAVAQLREAARSAGLAIEVEQADLEAPDWHLALPRPDLVVVVNYLDRALLDVLPARLAPGGALLVATFTKGREGDHPSDRWCLEPGELVARYRPSERVRSEERDGRAGVLARFGEISGATPD